MSIDTKVLLLDEPSATLTLKEIQSMFGIIRQIKQQGVTVVYISHRLEEIFEIADTVTVLKDGVCISTQPMEGMTSSELVRMMIGRKMDDLFPELKPSGSSEIVMKVEKLNNYKVKDISFELKSGEILGIYGVVGSGQRELAEALFGVDTHELEIGRYEIGGRPVNIRATVKAVEIGLAYIPEERKLVGLMLRLSVGENITIPYISRFANRLGIIKKSKENENVGKDDRYAERKDSLAKGAGKQPLRREPAKDSDSEMAG